MFAQKKRSVLINFKGMFFVVAAAGVGCAPLQQAPLVYTSSHVIGVKIGVAPTQPESLEAVIGYKDLDAAYAPVAVSNPHLNEAMKPGNKYDKDLYEIKEIYGIYGTQASAAGASNLLTDEESADMQVYFERFSAKESAAKTAGSAKLSWLEAQKLKTLADNLKIEPRTDACRPFLPKDTIKNSYQNFFNCSTADAQEEVIRKYSLLSNLDKTYDIIDKEQNDAKDIYDKANAASQSAITNFALVSDKVKGALEKLASIQKRDAISVYGSFDADTGAETAKPLAGTPSEGDNGVKVKVGKVFSTGVAAQNVSEAQKIAASAVIISACINAIGDQANKVYPDPNAGGARKEYLLALIPECFKVKKDK
ncbi:hypothetical protein [Pseudomonas sp. SWRI179]|uniref:hypothetical protein n=1 Tax=Pseudomonas sp. SWRI179 TaxID=2745497 RepID=UPI001648136E|nr:hypothetical protein [Pseudomonas sp. SWRI179]MBC3384940.1 hypothetical protein [Pseudomonas sp. SWRI179]